MLSPFRQSQGLQVIEYNLELKRELEAFREHNSVLAMELRKAQVEIQKLRSSSDPKGLKSDLADGAESEWAKLKESIDNLSDQQRTKDLAKSFSGKFESLLNGYKFNDKLTPLANESRSAAHKFPEASSNDEPPESANQSDAAAHNFIAASSNDGLLASAMKFCTIFAGPNNSRTSVLKKAADKIQEGKAKSTGEQNSSSPSSGVFAQFSKWDQSHTAVVPAAIEIIDAFGELWDNVIEACKKQEALLNPQGVAGEAESSAQ